LAKSRKLGTKIEAKGAHWGRRASSAWRSIFEI